MYNHFLFLGYWLINSFVLYLASVLLPNTVIKLGNWRFSSIEASFYAGFFLTFLIWVWWDFAMARKFDFTKKAPTFALFFFINVFSLIAISRFNYFTGFAVSNLLWVAIIGLAATIVQRIIRIFIVKQKSFHA